MAHHSSSSDDEEIRRAFSRRMQDRADMAEQLFPKLGATGRFPEGKLTKLDEGELQVAIGEKDGKVVIDFGKPVAWVGFSAEQAIDLGELLARRGRELRGG